MRSSDPRLLGERECKAWVAYYRPDWGTSLRAALGLTRHAVAAPDVRLAARERAFAMHECDRWVREGRDPGSELIRAVRAALVRAYAALLATVYRG